MTKLKNAVRRSANAFKELVNKLLRVRLTSRSNAMPRKPFKVKARSLGTFPGLNYDNIEELIEQAEGPLHR